MKILKDLAAELGLDAGGPYRKCQALIGPFASRQEATNCAGLAYEHGDWVVIGIYAPQQEA